MRRNVTVSLALLPFVLVLGWAAAGVVLAGGGCHFAGTSEPLTSEAASTVVKMDGCTYAPTVTRVPVGAQVRFVNSSQTYHDVTGRSREWGTDVLDAGEEYRHRFGTAGVYPYSCSLHPGMAGVVIVGALAAAGTDADSADADIAPVSATTPAAAPVADTSPVPYLAAGGLGLLAGLGVGAAVVNRRRRPA
jgi:plastocyanin